MKSQDGNNVTKGSQKSPAKVSVINTPPPNMPIGVFWDIENCPVPSGKSALAVVQLIRDRFFVGLREAEFLCVCDTSKENKLILEELNQAQVTVIHINATSKNAADDKLKQQLRRFANTHSPPAKIILISGDVNFAPELSDLRHRQNFTIILLYRNHSSPALLACAHESHAYETLLSEIRCKSPTRDKVNDTSTDLLVSNLPKDRDIRSIKGRLKQLSSNCGGKVVNISRASALISFTSQDVAERALKRMEGEDVFGSKIQICFAPPSNGNLSKCNSPRKRNNLRKSRSCGSPNRHPGPRGRSPTHFGYCPNTYRPRPWQSPNYHHNARGYRYDSNFSYHERYYYQPQYVKPDSRMYWSADERNPDDSGCIGDVVDKFTRENKNGREFMYMKQQMYQEDPDLGMNFDPDMAAGIGSSHSSTPQFSSSSRSRTPSKSPHGWSSGGERTSPSFRKTPGSQRPSSRNSGSRTSSPVYENSQTFQPIRSYSPLSCESDAGSAGGGYQSSGPGVELIVSNLDYNIRGREWKKLLFTEFQQHVKILGVYIQGQPDNTSIAYVKVPSIEDARYAISQFHRKKIGYKRIHVTLVTQEETHQVSADTRAEVITLLRDATANTLPLFKFIELFEKRFGHTISTADLYRMKDVVEIRDQEGAGRLVTLIYQGGESPDGTGDDTLKELESPVCKIHCTSPDATVEQQNLPNVVIQLKSFATHLHSLLQSHDGAIPLISFLTCYAAEFSPMRTVHGNSAGVPLEHLITCVPGVVISTTAIRKIMWSHNKPPDDSDDLDGMTLSQPLNLFGQEVVDLLSHQAHCSLLFTKFIPTYHHHFNKQCRVADYGYTKLLELLEAVPSVVQMIGTGSQRNLTLTHGTQVKRFISDLTKVLKSRASKQIEVIHIPTVYRRVVGREFDITEYGICYLEDMLSEIPETCISVSGMGTDMVLSLVRRDQTSSELERTEQFSMEVLDLLRQTESFQMPFRKFIPSYHHHFGRQCRVSDYGFTKLMELFEAIPQVVQIIDGEDEKFIRLVQDEVDKLLGDQVEQVLRQSPQQTVPVAEFLTTFIKVHDYCLRLQDHNVSSVSELIDKLPKVAKVVDKDGCLVIKLQTDYEVQKMGCQLLALISCTPGGSVSQKELCKQFKEKYMSDLDMGMVKDKLKDFVQVLGDGDTALVKLTPLQQFAMDMCTLLRKHAGQLALQEVEASYSQYFGVSLVPAAYGYRSVVAMLEAIPHVIGIYGKGVSRVTVLKKEFGGTVNEAMYSQIRVTSPKSDSGTECHDDDELLLAQAAQQHRMDLLCQPVPSAVPSPTLHPETVQRDLIRFHQSPTPDVLAQMTDDEKRTQWTPLCRTPVSEILQLAAQCLPKTDKPYSHQPTPGWMNNQEVPQLNKTQQQHVDRRQKAPYPSGLFTVSHLHEGVEPETSIPCNHYQKAVWEKKSNHMANGMAHNPKAKEEVNAKFASNPGQLPAPEMYNMKVRDQQVPEVERLSKCQPQQEVPKDVINNSPSSSSCSSPSKLLTPRRCRLAAKFTHPLSPAQSE